MLKKISISLLAGMLSVTDIDAQETERIETDRPDQTESPFTVPKKWIQVETGFSYERINSSTQMFLHPGTLTKYGLGKKIELRLVTTFSTEIMQRIPNAVSVSGLQPVQVGFKAALCQEKGIRPKTSLIAHISLPGIASKGLNAGKPAPDFVFTMQHTFTPRFGLGYNAGAEWDGFTNTPIWIYRVSPGFNIGKKWYAYIEAFGFLQRHKTAGHNIDGGFAYYAGNNLKLDISGGKGLSNASGRYYLAIGASWRSRL